jgi:hypothetical protein
MIAGAGLLEGAPEIILPAAGAIALLSMVGHAGRRHSTWLRAEKISF